MIRPPTLCTPISLSDDGPSFFYPVGILKIIDSLKLSSSVGVDDINSKVLKNTRII